MSICIWGRSGTSGSEGPDHLASPSTFQSPERVPTPACGLTPSSFSLWHFGNRCLKLNLCSAGCLSVARLSFSSVPHPLQPGNCLNRGHNTSKHPARSIHVWQWDRGSARVPDSPSTSGAAGTEQGRRREDRGLEGARGLFSKQTPAIIWALTWSSSLYLTPIWHHWPRRTRADKVPLLGGTSSRLSLGARLWGLYRGQPGFGHYLTISLNFGSLRGVFLLISHCTVRNQICEAVGSHFRAYLLPEEDERIYLAAQGILLQPVSSNNGLLSLSLVGCSIKWNRNI